MAKAKDENRVVIKVFLYGIQPQIWRKFSISKDVTFIALSDAIQAAMGWDNKHPHEFRHGKGKRLVDVIGPIGLEDQTAGEFQDEAVLTVAEYLGKRRLPIRMLYRYDFADEWIHEVVFEKWVAGEGGPAMIDGLRNCPEEDCGGTFQYMQALHGEIEWLRPGYDPEAFDIKAVSFEPKKSKRAR
ncbi:MAG: plasmid pRiA4b ORF-3 family protein [Gloeobacteraceae cyanobacterium ES-bin-144]|nr:plasmid pRiA4b ORF-3 family protein [Verrucomicrobiales bacterium]